MKTQKIFRIVLVVSAFAALLAPFGGRPRQAEAAPVISWSTPLVSMPLSDTVRVNLANIGTSGQCIGTFTIYNSNGGAVVPDVLFAGPGVADFRDTPGSALGEPSFGFRVVVTLSTGHLNQCLPSVEILGSQRIFIGSPVP